MERDFFLTEYIGGERAEIKCTIKLLCSDFIVNEITPDGTILDISLPCKVETVNKAENTASWSANLVDNFPPPESLSPTTVADIESIVDDKTRTVEIPTGDMDKDKRKSIHLWIANRFKGLLDSETVSKAVRVTAVNTKIRKRSVWPIGRPDYVLFTLCKENKDTNYAISLIAKFLRMSTSSFGICGTKDRRGITTQRVSVYRCEIQRLQEISAKLRGIKLVDFVPSHKPCKLGDLWGNRFKVILRGVEEYDGTDLIARIEDFKCKGFINYFGTQRFGSCGVNTAQVGLYILKRQWENAAKTILKSRNVYGTIHDALVEWNSSGDSSAALKKLKGSQVYASIEGQLLSSLSKNNDNYQAALMKLPRNARSLYVHAYQSILWNKVASKIVRTGTLDFAGNFKIEESRNEDFGNNFALPLISGSAQFSNSEVQKWYEQAIAEDGVTMEMFKALEKDYAIGEVMRPLIVKPLDVNYKILTYSDPRAKLHPGLESSLDSGNIGTGNFRALAIDFSLPSGCYATVALRELTRCDMSKMAQVSLVGVEKVVSTESN